MISSNNEKNTIETFGAALKKLEDCLLDENYVTVTEDDKVLFTEEAKQHIHYMTDLIKQTNYYASCKNELNEFWDGSCELYTRTKENVFRVILEKMNDSKNEFLWYMSMLTHLPVLDEALNGGADD